jgi:hypothetical protein
MSGCIGCTDDFGYEKQSDGTLILSLVRDGITTTKTTSLKALNLSNDLNGLALHNALNPHLKALQKQRDLSDRA